MTRNRKKKLAVRAEAGEGSHARAARIHASEPRDILTADIQQGLVRSFGAAGWPVEHDGFPEGGVWTGWLGPVQSLLSRPGAADSEADPDDADQYDLTVVPELCFISPKIPTSREAMVLELPGTTPGADLVRQVSEQLALARAAEVSKLINSATCALCGDSYPSAHLLPPTESDRLLVCPFCVFDGDILGGHPLRLAYAIDAMTDNDLAAPAGWSAVTALLACAGGPALEERLKGAGGFRWPLPHWSDPDQVWVWLPPGDLPPALEGLAPGTSLATLVAAVERAHPDLRDHYRTELAASLELDEDEGEEEGATRGHRDYLVEQLWPAAICYAVTAATQERERPAGRSPWNLLEDGFEEGTLADHFDQVGSTLDADALGPVFTLSIGVPVIARALGWNPTP
ncbi:hypothetical protein [Streptomyces sp. NBC_01264]|uniref:hypothetical protein n=1 Tax=Streptomyces sp. NBC_01264 TaxID=2903804 RepID=UPI0022525621|nr:hypothetical protein [Streptomyces sp. NBC_01264]MCX4783891.1 hypothetical protein [Streptomyces sp. NBC_01264]